MCHVSYYPRCNTDERKCLDQTQNVLHFTQPNSEPSADLHNMLQGIEILIGIVTINQSLTFLSIMIVQGLKKQL